MPEDDAVATSRDFRSVHDPDASVIEVMARAAYAASCALSPVEEDQVPDWGRGGYKTEVMYWHGIARAALAAYRAEQEKA